MVPDILLYLMSYLQPYGCVLRVVCKHWAKYLPTKCLCRSFTHILVRYLEELYESQQDLPTFLKYLWYWRKYLIIHSDSEMYHCSHYWPPNVILQSWITKLFEQAIEIRNFNWKSLLDDHYSAKNLPPIFHRINIYAFNILASFDESSTHFA